MSRTKYAVIGMCSFFAIASFLTCTSEVISPNTGFNPAQSADVVDDNQTYYDCLDHDVSEEYICVDIPEVSSCEAHGTCVDACVSEGELDDCFLDCDATYLGIDPEYGTCGCESCLQECNELCYCGIGTHSH